MALQDIQLPKFIMDVCTPENVVSKDQRIRDVTTVFSVSITDPIIQDWEIFILWAHSLYDRNIYHIGTCKDCANPFEYPQYRCDCTKCKSTKLVPPLFERFWFGNRPSGPNNNYRFEPRLGSKLLLPLLSDKVTINQESVQEIKIPLQIQSSFMLESKPPIISPRKSIMCLGYNRDSTPEDFRNKLEEWRHSLIENGYESKETCYSSDDPCDRLSDSMCYLCREWGSCGYYKLWIYKSKKDVSSSF